MKTVIESVKSAVQEEGHYHPVISILLPFNPKMTRKSKLLESLDMAADKVELELLEKYPDDMALLMIEKLRNVIRSLNFNTHKKSIAIFLSPVFEKVFYLDISVIQKVSIDGSFEIRDLVFHKKQEQAFIVMLLTNKESRLYLGESGNLTRIVTTTARSLYHPIKTADVADTHENKEITLQEFLRQSDNTLAIILKAYPLPLFIAGSENMVKEFKQVTSCQDAVTAYIEQDVADTTIPEIRKLVTPHISNWGSVQQQHLFNQLNLAAKNKKLAVGIKEVWREAMSRKGSLLLIERSYNFSGQQNTSDEILFNVIESYHPYSYIKNVVDDIIKKVFENGGDVEFTDDGFLKDYQSIVLL